MCFSLPPVLREEPAGSGDGEESVVLLEPPADFPQFVSCGYCVQDHYELGDLVSGGGVLCGR